MAFCLLVYIEDLPCRLGGKRFSLYCMRISYFVLGYPESMIHHNKLNLCVIHTCTVQPEICVDREKEEENKGKQQIHVSSNRMLRLMFYFEPLCLVQCSVLSWSDFPGIWLNPENQICMLSVDVFRCLVEICLLNIDWLPV